MIASINPRDATDEDEDGNFELETELQDKHQLLLLQLLQTGRNKEKRETKIRN
jgi:hypothetical protein